MVMIEIHICIFYFKDFIYLFLGAYLCKWGGEGQREREREPDYLLSMEPAGGTNVMTSRPWLEVKSRVGCSTDWAIQVPSKYHFKLVLFPQINFWVPFLPHTWCSYFVWNCFKIHKLVWGSTDSFLVFSFPTGEHDGFPYKSSFKVIQSSLYFMATLLLRSCFLRLFPASWPWPHCAVLSPVQILPPQCPLSPQTPWNLCCFTQWLRLLWGTCHLPLLSVSL